MENEAKMAAGDGESGEVKISGGETDVSVGSESRENGQGEKEAAERIAGLEDELKRVAGLEGEQKRIRCVLTELGGEFAGTDEKRIRELVSKLTAERDAARGETAKLRVDFALGDALRAAGARNRKALEALLDTDRISVDEDGNVQGLEGQIRALKRSDPYLFEHDRAGTGNAKSLGRALRGADTESLGKRLGAMAKKAR